MKLLNSGSECVTNCQNHVISVNEASLHHNCFEMFLHFNDSLLEGGGGGGVAVNQ